MINRTCSPDKCWDCTRTIKGNYFCHRYKKIVVHHEKCPTQFYMMCFQPEENNEDHKDDSE